VTGSKQSQVIRKHVPGSPGTAAGTKVIIRGCLGGINQQRNLNGDGGISGVQSALCLDAIGGGTQIAPWLCSAAGSNQTWTRQ
jgi:hypothetical protein